MMAEQARMLEVRRLQDDVRAQLIRREYASRRVRAGDRSAVSDFNRADFALDRAVKDLLELL